MHKIALVVFDIAGTTLHDDGSIVSSFQEAMLAHGYDVPADRINPLMGYKKTKAIRMMLTEFEMDKEKITSVLINDIHERFERQMVTFYEHTPSLVPLPNVLKVFAALKKNGIKIGINTGFSRVIADAIMNRLGWVNDGVVDYLVASDEVEAGRPAPYMIQKMMELANITDSLQVVKVGDTEVDINEGQNAGCLFSIGVTTGAFSTEMLLPHHPSFILDDMIELLPILHINN